MKRMTAALAAALCLFAAAAGLYWHDVRKLEECRAELIYRNVDERNSCMEAMELVLGEQTIPGLGSSELFAAEDVAAFPQYLFRNGQSDFNMILIGRGYMQSIHHAVNAGALEPYIKDKKAVLILSPQWFTKAHLAPETYASRFSEEAYAAFMKNPAISGPLKKRVAERMEALLTADPAQLERMQKVRRAVLEHTLNLAERVEMGLYSRFMDLKAVHTLANALEPAGAAKAPDKAGAANSPGVEAQDAVKAGELDFLALLPEAEAAGKRACTNNEYYIFDAYYDTYVRDALEKRKGGQAKDSYMDSPEYGDLRLFLEVCRETGIQPLIVSIPVNGKWYDWTGFPKEDREGYYQKIRDICEEYQVPLADFSGKEYEPYFLKDVMHLGWKGWVYVDEAVYRFYQSGAEE